MLFWDRTLFSAVADMKRYAIKLRFASRSHFYSPMLFFILISIYAERQTYYQYTSKFPGKKKSCIYCTSRLTAFIKRLRIQGRNRDFSLEFGPRKLISTFFVKIRLNFKYVNQLNISFINIKLFFSIIKRKKESFQLSVILIPYFIIKTFLLCKFR